MRDDAESDRSSRKGHAVKKGGRLPRLNSYQRRFFSIAHLITPRSRREMLFARAEYYWRSLVPNVFSTELPKRSQPARLAGKLMIPYS